MNGDYLALDLRAIETDPPVVYLNHDDESFLLSPDFVAFLSAWERLCYIGPEHWLLSEFAGAGGYLDPTAIERLSCEASSSADQIHDRPAQSTSGNGFRCRSTVSRLRSIRFIGQGDCGSPSTDAGTKRRSLQGRLSPRVGTVRCGSANCERAADGAVAVPRIGSIQACRYCRAAPSGVSGLESASDQVALWWVWYWHFLR